MADNSGEDQASEEEKPGAQQPRKESEYLVRQCCDRGQHARKAQGLQRDHQANQPNQPVGEAAELGTDGFTAGLRMARNSATVLAAIRTRTGISIQVISGEEEGRLAYSP